MRLKHPWIGVVRRLVAVGPVRDLVFRAAGKDFGLDLLAALPADARSVLDDTMRPRAGRPAHAWEDAGLGAPTPPAGSAADLTDRYAAGTLDPVAVLERVRGRLMGDDFGCSVHNPAITLCLEGATRAAEASAARWRDGAPRGPLDGVPVVVKDEVDIAGLPTWGGTAYRSTPAARDAWVIQRLRGAGAVIVGKSHATEWGLNPWGGNVHRDLPRNTRSSDHGAGGSSTGTGVAVSLGFVPVGLGSDGGGSIRIPAALNGVFGLKPSFVRIGRTGNPWGPGSMSHLGPLGRSPEDLVRFLGATAGVDPDDPTTLQAPDGHQVADAWRAALGRGVKGARIGIVEAAWADADPAVASAARDALKALEADGAELVDVVLPIEAATAAVGALTISAESMAHLSDDRAEHGDAYGDELALILSLMEGLSARELLSAHRTRGALRRQVARLFAEDVDLLAFPTTATTAPRYPLSDAGTDILDPAATAAMTRFAFLANLTGIPAGTAPCGLIEGLPTGVQFVGDAWDEASVLAALAHGARQGWTELPAAPGALDWAG